MLQHLPALRIAPSFPAPGQLPDLFRFSKRESPWERSLQVGFEELDRVLSVGMSNSLFGLSHPPWDAILVLEIGRTECGFQAAFFPR
jgi:hypothetical protein